MAERIPDPATVEEYNALQHANARVEGRFMETAMVAPCPGCCQPDWSTWKIVEVREHMSAGAVCKNCGRGFKVLFTEESEAHTSYEFVQTCGPDVPSYLPKIRRVDP